MASELGQAYVQIIPSAKGISGAISKELGGAAEPAGKSAGGRLGGAIKGALATAGIGAALSKTLGEGADLEQSVGGIETLFKDSAGKMKEYASQAYQTAGVSANTYMETVTSFSASLLQSLGGDTAKAADTANMAMVDMSDNANKMGTNMEDIQNAYQGFAKQNYTMLDNLKLGYGGTKKEMERLLSDAEKFSGQKYDISNLNDVYSAIHVIQGELDITGTTAKEASTTLAGSFGAMKAAFSDFLGNLTLGNDIKPSLQALVQTASTYLFDNLLPAVGNIIGGLPGAIGTLLETGIPELMENGGKLIRGLVVGLQAGIPNMITSLGGIVTLVQNLIPQLVGAGKELISDVSQGLADGIPELLSSILPLVSDLSGTIRAGAGQLVDAGIELIRNLATGIANSIPTLLENIPTIVSNIAGIINDNVPKLFAAAGNIVLTLGKGIINAIPTLVANLPQIFQAIWDVIQAFNWVNLGRDIINFLGNGIKSAAGFVVNAVKNIVSKVQGAVFALPGKFLGFGKSIISSLAAGVKAMHGLAVNGIKSLVKGMLNGILGFGSKIMSAGKTLISKLASGLRNAASDVWNAAKGIAEKLLRPIKDVQSKIKGIVDKIKGFFKFHFPTPHIPVPHFRISPSGWKVGDLLHGSIPSLSVKWYATGGVFNRSSIIGVGEAGPEAVLPLTTLWSKFSEMADSIVNGVGLQLAAAGAGSSGPVHLTLYLWPSGPKAGEWVVNTYDEYKRKKG